MLEEHIQEIMTYKKLGTLLRSIRNPFLYMAGVKESVLPRLITQPKD